MSMKQILRDQEFKLFQIAWVLSDSSVCKYYFYTFLKLGLPDVSIYKDNVMVSCHHPVGEIDTFTTVANALNETLRNKIVYSDFSEIDPGVLRLLFDKEEVKPDFELRNYHELIEHHAQVDECSSRLDVYDEPNGSLIFGMDDYIVDAEHKATNLSDMIDVINQLNQGV